MPSIHPNYEYDIFISYRQNDNKRDGWVTNFVEALRDELEATIKHPVSIYFDENPNDGLLETHLVNASLTKKLKCLVFIPIISQTYCDTKSFAWEHEFLPFNQMAKGDELGMNITLANGNVTSRVLPIKIHDIDAGDQKILEKELNGPLRSIDFIYREAGVNRPLRPNDNEEKNINKTIYRNQINKVANALKDIGNSILNPPENRSNLSTSSASKVQTTHTAATTHKRKWLLPVAVIALLVALYFLISPYVFNKTTDKDISEVGLAIMPLKNIANNAAIDFLSFALKEETQDILSLTQQFGFLSSRMATAIYNNKDISPKEVGDALGVDYVLAGTYRLSGEQLKVSVELVDSYTGNSVWQESYDIVYAEENINPLQGEIAKKVLAEFNVTNDNTTPSQQTINFEAYTHYVKGLEWMQKGWRQNTLLKAIVEFEQAVKLAPAYSQAWLQLVATKSVLVFLDQQPLDKYQTGLNEHLAVLASGHPQWAANLANGIYQYHALSNYENGFGYFQQVLDQQPDNEMANVLISYIYRRRLDVNRAYQHITKAIQLNPNNPAHWFELSRNFRINGDYNREAKSLLREVDLGFDSTYYPDLHQAYHRASLPLDSIPKKYRDSNNKIVAMQNVFDSGDPNKVIEVVTTVLKDNISGVDKYTYTEYYSDMAVAHQALYADDSARYYANLCVQEQLKHVWVEQWPYWGYLSACYCILGELNKSNEVIVQYASAEAEDKLILANRKIRGIENLVLAKKYEAATELLITFNKDFPNYGDFHRISTSFLYDRAKKEHPPFAEAVANLKLPPPLVEDNSLKRLDY